MPRPPSVRRSALSIVARNTKRIEKRQLAAESRGEEYELTEKDLEAILHAAKVASMLERVKSEEEDAPEEKAGAPKESEEERLRRIEANPPARVSRGVDEEDDP